MLGADGRNAQVPRRVGVRARAPAARGATGEAAREAGSSTGQRTSVSLATAFRVLTKSPLYFPLLYMHDK